MSELSIVQSPAGVISTLADSIRGHGGRGEGWQGLFGRAQGPPLHATPIRPPETTAASRVFRPTAAVALQGALSVRESALGEADFVGVLLLAAIDDDGLVDRGTHRPVGEALFVEVGDLAAVEVAFVAVGANVLDQ